MNVLRIVTCAVVAHAQTQRAAISVIAREDTSSTKLELNAWIWMSANMDFAMRIVKICQEVTIVNVLQATVNMSTGRAVLTLTSA